MGFHIKIAQQDFQQQQDQERELEDLQDDVIEFPSSDTVLLKTPGLKKKLKKVRAEKEKKLREKEQQKLKTETVHIETQKLEIRKLEESAERIRLQIQAREKDSLQREESKKQILLEIQKREAAKPKPPGIFNDHLLQTKEIRPQVLQPDPNWITMIFIGLVIILTLVKRYYGKKTSLIFATFLGSTTQLFREDSTIPKRLSISLWIVFIFSGSLFLYKLSELYDLKDQPLYMGYPFIAITIILTLICIGQIISMHVISYIFDATKETEDHILNIKTFYFTSGILLFPLALLIFYATELSPGIFLTTGIIIFGLAYFYRLIKGFLMGISQPGISTIHLFLYLCTLEILPVLVICKIFIPNI